MNVRSQRIPRRQLLRGVGAALALPWLEAMGSTLSAGVQTDSTAPIRLGVLFMPNGVRPGKWIPERSGEDFQLSEMLQPLSPFQKETLVLSNLWNRASKPGDGHYVKTAGLLTSKTINKTTGVDLNCNGISMDQIAASHLGKLTPLPSLELGIEPVPTGVDGVVGYTRVYGAHISWRGPTQPLAKEIHPRLVYERLLRSTRPRSEDSLADKQLLDLVLEEANQLRATLGANDRRRIDEYLDGVRSLEQRIQRLEDEDGRIWKPRASLDTAVPPPESIPEKHAEHVRLMLDLIVLAFQTDVTRISTLMLGNSVSNINFSFLEGVSEGFHSVSHHENKEDKLAQYQRIGTWHVEQLAYLLERLRHCQEDDSNLLDRSMILFASDLSDGNAHNPHNLPVVLAGRAGGRLRTGRHLQYSPDTPLANLYVTMLTALGMDIQQFADSTGPMENVLA